MSYQDQIIDVEVVVKLVGPTLVPLLEPGEMYCWVSEEGACDVSQIIINALAALDPALANVWRLHDIENKSYSEITRIKGWVRGQARQRHARAARQLRRSFVKSDARRKLAHAIYVDLRTLWCNTPE